MNKAKEIVKENDKIIKSDEYIEIEGIIKQSPEFYDGLISEVLLKKLYSLINCWNYQKSTLYIELIEKFCKNEMNPNLCFDIIIDHKNSIISIKHDIEKNFIHNINQKLISDSKLDTSNENHRFVKRKLNNVIFELSTFKDIFKVINYNDIYNYFLDISEWEKYFDKYKQTDNLDEDTLLKLIIWAHFLKLFWASIINIKWKNIVSLKLQNWEKDIKIWLDPRVKVEVIWWENIRYNWFLAEELQEIINLCISEFSSRIELIISNVEKIKHENPEIKKLKERKDEYYDNILRLIISSDEEELKKEKQIIILNAVECFWNVNKIHSNMKEIWFNTFLKEKIKFELSKQMWNIFREETINWIAWFILRENMDYAKELIWDFLINMIKDNKQIVSYFTVFKLVQDNIKKSNFKFLLSYYSNLSPNDINSWFEKPYLIISKKIFTNIFPSIKIPETLYYWKHKNLIKIERIEHYFRILKEIIENDKKEYLELLKSNLIEMLMTPAKERKLKSLD